MSRARSPYEVLGLAPGADRTAIDAAYRRLIKQHHPDVDGGDGETAKAVIHAYRALLQPPGKLPVLVQAPPLPPRPGIRWMRWVVLTGLTAVLLWAPWPRIDWARLLPSRPESVAVTPVERRVPELLQARVAPDGAAVEAGVSEAERLERGSTAETVGYSQSCSLDLHRLPGDGLLDHCVAFDLAAARGRAASDPWFAVATMGQRHAAAAKRVLDDPVLAEARVREVGRLVERQLVEGPR